MGRLDARWTWTVGLLAAAWLATAASGTTTTPPPTLPADGFAIERDLAGGEHHAWVVELAAGDFLRAVVEQRGIDLVLRLLPAGGGEPIVEIDSPNGTRGPERLSFVAAADGTYLLEVRSNYADDPAGRYALAVEALRPASGDDRKLAAAEAAVQRGIVGDLVVRTAESRRAAAEAYGEALDLWRQLGDERREAETWNHLAFLYSRLGEVDREAEAFARHLEIVRGVGGEEEIARALLNLAAAYSKQGRLHDAEPLYRRALDTFERVGDRRRQASTWNALGSLHSRRGDLHAARDDFARALASARDLGDLSRQAQVLVNLGRVNSYLGNPRLAVEQLQEAVRLARQAEEPASVTAALNNLGVAYGYQGRMQEALSTHLEVLALERRRGNRRGEAYALNNLAVVYNGLGQPADALAHYRSTLEIQRQVGDRIAEAKSLSNVGWTLHELDRVEEAVPYFEQALALARQLGERHLEVAMLFHLGRVQREAGETDAALALLEPALASSRELGLRFNEANLLLEIGRTVAARDPQAALARLAEAGDVADSLDHPLTEAAVRYETARLERGRGRLDAARAQLEEALARLEEVRTTVDVLELRNSLFAHRGDYHEAYVGLLMALDDREPDGGWAERAFTAAEAARARGFLDLLRESEVDVRKGADPKLLDRERELRRRLSSLERRRQELFAESADDASLAAVERELRGAREEARFAEAELRASSSRYATLTRPEPMTPQAVRTQLLDAGTALLAYSLGSDESFLWAITRDAVATFRLPPRSILEPLARRLHEALSRPGGDAALAGELGELLLAPAAHLVAGKRLVIVADGALHYVPFAALTDPASGDAAPLVVAHEVVQLPSASVLSVLRRDHADRAPAPRLLAVFADPVFQADDPRVGSPGARVAAGDGSRLRGAEGGLDFRRLRFSGREAERIARLVPAGERLEATGFAASRDAATSPALAGYRYVHFATHGVVDATYPELSGLVLSLVDEQGRPADGFLRLHDLYNLELNAELVTLSACRTALGQEIRGEGLIGLTRGFMYAGAERVVASLWDVQDRATAEIMSRFYTAILEEGLAPAAALRRAQLSMQGEPRWSDPYYWAPFVLQGEWR